MENKDFVFMGNMTYDTLNWGIETGLSEGLRIGPVIDPHTGEYTTQWPCMVGKYVLIDRVIRECNIVKGRDGRNITLERALDMALAKALGGGK